MKDLLGILGDILIYFDADADCNFVINIDNISE